MNGDFHYYATYCAAVIAGYSHEEAAEICYSAQLVDHSTRTWLKRLRAPQAAATTQLQSELINARTDIIGLQDITRIWSSFHFLPANLHAKVNRGSQRYKNKYRLICGPNGDLAVKTVKLAKGKSLQAAGIAMHVIADTWAHTHFAGTPSLVINNTDRNFFEIVPDGDGYFRRPIVFGHNPAAKENPETGAYTGSIYQSNENSIMNLGHGRAGHLPDYSFIRYAYSPAWNNYKEILKDNPNDYLHAFAQMVYAMMYLRDDIPEFKKKTYAWDKIDPYLDDIQDLIEIRRTDDTEDWKKLGESITNETIRPFELDEYSGEFTDAGSIEEQKQTTLGRFFIAAVAQKAMVTSEIEKSGSNLAGKAGDEKRNKHGKEEEIL